MTSTLYPVSKFEQHVRTAAGAALLALATWIALSVTQLRERQAAIGVSLEALREEMRSRMVDRYTATEAAKDFAARDDARRALRARMDRLEQACAPARELQRR